jgi:hypothetical protein
VRYGAEFEVLLEDAPLRWSDVADVIRGAVEMRMNGWMTYGKMALLWGLVGTLVAAGIAFSIADRYVCSGAMMLENSMQGSPVLARARTLQALQEANMHLLTRDNLVNLIQKLNLYQKDRQRLPVADIAQNQFRKQVHIIPYRMTDDAGGAQAFHIVFEYPDKYQAKALVDELISEYEAWFLTQAQQGANSPFRLSVLENPIVPEKPTSPVRLAIVIIGLSAGTFIGLVALMLWRRFHSYAVVTMSIPKETKQFIDRQIAAGPYRDAGEYLRGLIRAEEERHK